MATPRAAGRSKERETLVAELETAGFLNDPRLEEAMLEVPRHLFLPPDIRNRAYDDRPLEVGHEQTISAPHMVAMMTTALQLEAGDNVLEVGGGVGYHASVLKAMVGPEGHVTTIEYVEALADRARENVKRAGFDVEVVHGDGYAGFRDRAPFDAIIITCAVPAIPQRLIDQLRDGGHLVAPVGVTHCQLVAGRKVHGGLVTDDLGSCMFVNAQGRLGGRGDDPPIQPAP